MTKSIKNASDLPGWFSLEKYKRMGTLDAAGWYNQLFIRRRCFMDAEQGHDMSAVVAHIRDVPIVDVSENSLFGQYFYLMFNECPLIEQSTCGVHSLTVHELYMAEANIEASQRAQTRAFFERMLDMSPRNSEEPSAEINFDLAFLLKPMPHVLKNPIDHVFLSVNLLLSDKVLIEQFKTHLFQLREECNANFFSQKWRQPKFTEWVRLGILPCLDLMMWEYEAKVNLPDRVMADAIYPQGKLDEETVRKTTKPKALDLIAETTLALLARMAIHEKETTQCE
ncbi:MAG: hypothetical protein KGI54_08240 [Pseudomonadota bacterium]|nr:hypothetical protein [Pseudomonadota bacterium]